MKHRLTIAAIAITAALGGTCAFLVPAASAGAQRRHDAHRVPLPPSPSPFLPPSLFPRSFERKADEIGRAGPGFDPRAR
jgi:hypothetical protein